MGGESFPAYPKFKTMEVNYKIDRVATSFLKNTGGSYPYTFKGKQYDITHESLMTLPRELQQSFGHFCAQKNPPRQAKSYMPKLTPPQRGWNYIPPVVTTKETAKEALVRKELLRIALTEVPIEEKLNIPKVFRALITEPHTALDQRKITMESKINLTLFVDTNVRYHVQDYMGDVDKSLHSTIIKVAKTIKGITLFAGSALYLMEYKNESQKYFTDIYRVLPLKLKQKVVVFSQGCGNIGDYEGIPKGAVQFCTGFIHGHNCGCEQLKKAAMAKMTMHYGITSVESLKLIK